MVLMRRLAASLATLALFVLFTWQMLEGMSA